MKPRTTTLPLLIVAASLLLSACSGLNLSFSAPEATTAPAPAAVQVAPATTKNTSAQVPQITVPPQVVDLQSAYEAVYEAVNPSVVNIQISAVPSSGRSRGSVPGAQAIPVAEGSGFVWDAAGHIVTNNHVVEGASAISVTFSDGTTVSATLVGADPRSDLAVIKAASLPAGVKPITVADSTKVKVGQIVIAIGNPFGLAGTMTTGIVSAISRSIPSTADSQGGAATGTYSIPDVIQTDAAINPGNSGGVLLDLQGSLIGVPSQIESSTNSNSGVGFAVPSSIVQKVVPALIQNGKVAHSWLGISGTSLTASLASSLQLNANQKGIYVASVTANGPAAKAGLRSGASDTAGNPTSGDVIVAVDGQAVTRFEDLVSYLFNKTQPGQTIQLTILRDGQQQTLSVALAAQPSA